jgi:hypothetical protein
VCVVRRPAARDQATHVFEGVLVNAIPASDAAPGRAVFRVDRVWKGRVSRTFTVQATIGLTMCPPHLEVGQRYILYTAGSNAAPRVEACTRFAAGESLETERRALGTPTQTYADHGPLSHSAPRRRTRHSRRWSRQASARHPEAVRRTATV